MKKTWRSVLWRIVRSGLILSGILVSVAGAALGGQSLYRWALTSPEFALKQITVTGNELVPADEVIALAGLSEGDNLFRIDLTEAGVRMALDRRFKKVLLRRHLPDRVEIVIRERPMLALIQLDRLYGIDTDGHILPLPSVDRLPGLPLISGLVDGPGRISAAAFTDQAGYGVGIPDTIGYDPRVQRGLYVIETVKAFEPEFIDRISEINVSDPANPVVYMNDNGASVRLGVGNYPQKLKRMRATLDQLKADHIETRWIDLRFNNQVIIRPIVNRDTDGKTPQKESKARGKRG
jgi:cell division protein FtsQ